MGAGNFKSKSPGLNFLAAELALDSASDPEEVRVLHHIPSVANGWADALSRVSAPNRAQVPEPLRAVPRDHPPRRQGSYWLQKGKEKKNPTNFYMTLGWYNTRAMQRA